MKKADLYRSTLRGLNDWDEYLLKASGLPGPRGNLELAQVVADEGDWKLFERYLTWDASRALTNSPHEFLAFCGVLGLGRLLAQGDRKALNVLRRYASDPRWRTREAVAMALQRLGETDMNRLLQEMEAWSQGSWLEQRAAAAALCEPKLLAEKRHTRQVLQLLDRITASLQRGQERAGEDFQALRKALGYCWSVAVAALPTDGKRLMEKWLASTDRDILWIMRENLKKNRLVRMDAAWVKTASEKLAR